MVQPMPHNLIDDRRPQIGRGSALPHRMRRKVALAR